MNYLCRVCAIDTGVSTIVINDHLFLETGPSKMADISNMIVPLELECFQEKVSFFILEGRIFYGLHNKCPY